MGRVSRPLPAERSPDWKLSGDVPLFISFW
jgi:hypothetical protein